MKTRRNTFYPLTRALLIVFALIFAVMPMAQADDMPDLTAVVFTINYEQTSGEQPNYIDDEWLGVCLYQNNPGFTGLKIQSPFGSIYDLEPYDVGEWVTQKIKEDFGNPWVDPVIFSAYDAANQLIGAAEWTLPAEWEPDNDGNSPIVPNATPQLTSGPEGSYWDNGRLVVQNNFISFSFNVGSWTNFVNDDQTRFDEIIVELESDTGNERYDFISFDEFDIFDPLTGIATVIFDSGNFTRTAGNTYRGWIEYVSPSLIPNEYGTTSGVLEGFLGATVIEKQNTFEVEVVPEPSSMLALGTGIVALGGLLRRRTK